MDWEDDGLGKEEEEEEEEEEGEGGAEGEITEGKTRPRRKTIIGTPIYMVHLPFPFFLSPLLILSTRHQKFSLKFMMVPWMFMHMGCWPLIFLLQNTI